MEPLKLNIKPHAASADEKEKTVAALKNNEEVRRLQDKIHFPETTLEHDTYKFVAWLKELEKCRGCKALSACKQKKEGYRRGLRYDDGLLQEVIEACPYRIAKTQLEKHRRNYTVADMGDALLQARFETIRLQGEPDGYVRAVQEALTCVRQRNTVRNLIASVLQIYWFWMISAPKKSMRGIGRFCWRYSIAACRTKR